MATNAKKPAKKVTAKKVTAKKVVHKKAPVASVHRTTVHTTKVADMKSFRPARRAEPFFTFRITHQTFYWLLLAVLVIGLCVWVTIISARVQNIYDQIDATNSRVLETPFPTHSVAPKQ